MLEITLKNLDTGQSLIATCDGVPDTNKAVLTLADHHKLDLKLSNTDRAIDGLLWAMSRVGGFELTFKLEKKPCDRAAS